MIGGLLLALGSVVAPMDVGQPTAVAMQDRSVEAQQAFGEELLAALARGATEPVDRLVTQAPYRATRLVYDLLREAAVAHPDPRPLDGARGVAASLERVRDSAREREDVERFVAGGEALRARWVEQHEHVERAARAMAAGRPDRAAEEARRGLAIVRADLRIPAVDSRVGRFLARVLADSSRWEEARTELADAIAIEEALELDHELYDDLRLLGRIESALGRQLPALAAYERALVLGPRLDRAEPVSRLELGVLHARLGRHATAHGYLDEVLETARAEDPALAAYVLTAKSGVESARGHYQAALRLGLEARDLARRSGSTVAEAGTLAHVAGIYSEIGRYPDAEDAIESALRLHGSEQATVQYARALQSLGLVLVDSGRPEAALARLERAQALFESLDYAVGRGETLQQRGRALLDLGRPEDAGFAFREARRVRAETGDHPAAALSAIGIGRAAEAAGRPDRALVSYEEALELLGPSDLPEYAWRARAGMARVLEELGREAEALEHARAALADVERLRRLLGSPALRERFLAGKLETYRRAARLCARAGETDEAFRWSQAIQSRTLLELFVAGTEEADARPELAGFARLRAAESELLQLEIALTDARRAGADEATLAELSERLRGARAAHADARLELSIEDPRGASAAGLVSARSLATVQGALREREVLLAYLVDTDGSAVWVVRRNAAQLVDLAVSREALETWIARIHRPLELLARGHTDVRNLGFDAAAARALHDALILPVRTLLADADALWIVPDGVLWRLPFALLVSERTKLRVDPARLYAQYAGCRFLVEDFATGYLPAASLVAAEAARGGEPQDGPSLVVGDPAPLPSGAAALTAAREEATRVHASLGTERGHLLLGEAASEGRVKTLAPTAAILHFAVHGELDDRRPAYSRIALAPGDGEDGWLHAFEVEALQLDAERVVLSACHGAGTPVAGEGLLGLARAFLQAGARSVVANVWGVDDEAARELVSLCYAPAAPGEHPLFALRRAQLEMMQRGRPGIAYVHPAFWAGIVRIGWE